MVRREGVTRSSLSSRSGGVLVCVVLQDLAAVVGRVPGLPCPTGPGAEEVLAGQVAGLRAAVVILQRELAVRGVALERASPAPVDVRGDAARAGMPAAQAAGLRRLGVFAARHPDLAAAWRSGALGQDLVELLRAGCARLARTGQAGRLVQIVLPVLPGLSVPAARELIDRVLDQLTPSAPDDDERAEHAARALCWARTPGGGITLSGYLPAAEADAFTTAVQAMTESLRAAGDGLTGAQRRADAPTPLTAAADPPAGGGLPAALTLTVSLTEATRIAARDPASIGAGHTRRPRGDAQIGGTPHAGRPAGDAAVRFGLCAALITPILHQPHPDPTEQTGHTAPAEPKRQTGPPPDSPLGLIAATPMQPLAVGRGLRLATTAQRHALRLRDRGCVIPGCGVHAAHTQPHHVQAWNLGGSTDLDNLVSLCWIHHRQTELGRWTFHPRTPGQPQPDRAHEHPHWWITAPAPMTRPPRPGRAL
jgi:HNH endonuclease